MHNLQIKESEALGNQWKKLTEKRLSQIKFIYKDAYNSIENKIRARIEKELAGEEMSPYAMKRLEAIKKEIKKDILEINMTMKKYNKTMVKETEGQVNTLAAETSPRMAKSFETFLSRDVSSYVKKGAYLKNFIDSTTQGYGKELLNQVEKTLGLGVIQRKSWTEISRDLKKDFGIFKVPYGPGGARHKAERLARTEIGRMRSITVNEFVGWDDQITGVEVGFGGGPCITNICPPKCGRYMKDGSELGLPILENFPPYHPNCRCFITEIFEKPK